MALPVRPDDQFTWAEDGGALKAEPGAGLKNEGWGIEKPSAQHFNWLFELIGYWIQLLDALVPNGSIVVHDTAGNVNASADRSSMILCNSTAGNQTVTLPTVTNNEGLEHTVKRENSGPNLVTVVGTIDGISNYVINSQNEFATFVVIDGAWRVAAKNDPANLRLKASIYSQWNFFSPAEEITFRGMTFGNQFFVAVGSTGTDRVQRSQYGTNWGGYTAAEANLWVDVAFGNNVFIAISSNGTNRTMRSTNNGETWAAVAAAAANGWQGITYGNGWFVAVSFDGSPRAMRTNNDGVSWTNAGITGVPAQVFRDVQFGDGVFIAVSEDGTDQIIRSTDNGLNWTAVNVAGSTYPFQKIAYGDGVWMIAANGDFDGTSKIFRSIDNGLTWTEATSTNAVGVAIDNGGGWSDIFYGDGIWIAIAIDDEGDNSAGALISYDKGLTFNPMELFDNSADPVTFSKSFQCGAYGNGFFVVMNQGSLCIKSQRSFLP